MTTGQSNIWVRRTRAAARAIALMSIILATLLVALDHALDLLFEAPDQGPCECTILARLPSPDGAWTAELEEYVYHVGIGGDPLLDGVLLRPANNPRRATFVLNIDTTGSVAERPRLAWTAPHILRVTVNARSWLKLNTRDVGPIHIDLRFDPPDPAARAEFLHWAHMDPQPRD